jgi:hypothetical protein
MPVLEIFSLAIHGAQLCFRIVEFIRQSKKVDQSFHVLTTEIEELSKVLHAFHSGLTQPSVDAATLELQPGANGEH